MARLKTANPYGDDFFAGPALPEPPAAVMEPDPATPPEPSPADPAPTKGRTVRLNLEMDRDLHCQLKRLAVDTDRTVAEVVRELVAQAVSSHSS